MEKILIENFWILFALFIWSLPWKGAALWRSARRGHIGWFMVFLILNTAGILEIVYLFVLSKNEVKTTSNEN